MRWISLSRKRTFQIIGSIIVFVLLASASGVIGNAMYAIIIWLWKTFIKQIWEQVNKPVTINSLLLFGSGVVLVTILIGFTLTLISSIEARKILSQAVVRSNKIIGLDDSLLRLLARLDPTKDLKSQIQKLLEELLRDAIRTFPDRTETYRASIFLPNSKNEYLKIRVHEGIPDKTIERSNFYIGQDNNLWKERGVAGTTYHTQQLLVGHITWKKEKWECDLECYKQFTQKDAQPSYNSFVSVPIIGLADEPLGVVCFDSHSSTVFDSTQVQSLLLIFCRRIAVVILIYISLSQSHQPSTT